MITSLRLDKPLRRVFAALTVASLSVGAAATATAQTNDPVIFSFSTVGDSRTDPGKADPTTLLANPQPPHRAASRA